MPSELQNHPNMISKATLLLSFLSTAVAQLPGELLDTIDTNRTSNLDAAVDILQIPSDDVDKTKCQLLGPLSLAIQALMGVVVIGSLLLKRARERPKRPWRIWALDVSKQVIGQATLHGSNVLISDLIANHSRSQQNPCTLYLLNILVDTTAGVLVLYFFLRLFSWILITKMHLSGLQTGFYGDPPLFSHWLRQLGVYLVALLLMKGCVVAFFALMPSVFQLGDKLLEWMGNNEEAQVVFTILIVPVVMNVMQFLIIDSIIRGKSQFDLLPEDEEAHAQMKDSDLDSDDDSETTRVDSQTAHDLSSAKARRTDLKHSIVADIMPLPLGEDPKPEGAASYNTLSSDASQSQEREGRESRRNSYGAMRIQLQPPEEAPLRNRVGRSDSSEKPQENALEGSPTS